MIYPRASNAGRAQNHRKKRRLSHGPFSAFQVVRSSRLLCFDTTTATRISVEGRWKLAVPKADCRLVVIVAHFRIAC